MIKSKDVLFLCQFFYPEKVSSATLPFDTAEMLVKNGLKVGCLCGYPKEYMFDSNKVEEYEIVNGIEINRLKYKTYSRKSKIGRIINYFSFVFKCLLNIKLIRDYEYIIVYSNPPILPYVAYKAHKKYGTKIIFVSYDVYPEIAINSNSISSNSLIAKVMNNINKKLFKSVDNVVALSNDMKDFLLKNRKLDENKVVYIPNWYNKEYFVERKRKDKFIIGYFGNLGICQDIETIMKCASKMKDNNKIKFIIGGHGNKMDYVKNFVDYNNLSNVTILPFLSGLDFENQMINADCFIVSLEKNLKGLCFPSKYYSYLAYGRPIIAICEESELTNEINNNKLGFCVNNGEYDILCEKIDYLVNNEDVDTICNNSFSRYEKYYKKEICTKKYVSLFKNDNINKEIKK